MKVNSNRLAKMIETLADAGCENIYKAVASHPGIVSKSFFLGPTLMDAAARENPDAFAARSDAVKHVMPCTESIQ